MLLSKLSRIIGGFNHLVGLLLLILSLHLLFKGLRADIPLGSVMGAISAGLSFFGLMLAFGRRWARFGLIAFYGLVLFGLAYAAWDEFRNPIDGEAMYPFLGVLALICALNIALLLSKPLDEEMREPREIKETNG